MRHKFLIIIVMAVGLVAFRAQAGQKNGVSSVFAILANPIDSKNVAVGQEITFKTISDVTVSGVIVVPTHSKILGRITQVTSSQKDKGQSAIAIVTDKAIRPDGLEVPLQAIIAAIAAPKDTSLSTDPAYGMMRSNEPKMSGSASGTASSGALSPSSKAESNAAVATANLKGAMEGPLLLSEESQGAIGYEGLSLSWSLAAPPPLTIFVSKNKSIKLSAGTQVLLRMSPPHLPQ